MQQTETKENKRDSLITKQDDTESWYSNIPELPDTWTIGEMYGEYLEYQDYESDRTITRVNYAHDEHIYKDGYETRLCAFDGIFGRW
jgi:hypothetical protein